MYPKLVIQLDKLRTNAEILSQTVHQAKCSMMIVTKSFCGEEKIVSMLSSQPGVDYLADSRMANLKKPWYQEAQQPKVLLRLPMENEIEEVVTYTDISFNSEISILHMLQEEAKRQGKKHGVVLMIDLGDLREGIFFQEEEEIEKTVEAILGMDHLELKGIGVNLTCYGAIIPKEDNLWILSDWANRLEKKFKISLEIVSGGNSSSYYLADQHPSLLPKRINNLRLGEAFILGNETAYSQKIQGTRDDALLLEAQIIEMKTKPSLPIGEVGVDAFGEKPVYEDKGMMKRAIVAIGKQDTDFGGLTPVDRRIEILGGSSDHMILDLTKTGETYKVGDILVFTMGYGAVLKAFTSSYVAKEYV